MSELFYTVLDRLKTLPRMALLSITDRTPGSESLWRACRASKSAEWLRQFVWLL